MSLGWGKTLREKGTWVELLVTGCSLGQHSPYTYVRCIHLHDKLPSDVGDLKDGRITEAVPQGLKGHICRMGPSEGSLGGCQGCERGSDGIIVADEAPVKIGKAQELLQLLTGFRDWPTPNCVQDEGRIIPAARESFM